MGDHNKTIKQHPKKICSMDSDGALSSMTLGGSIFTAFVKGGDETCVQNYYLHLLVEMQN